MTLFRRHRQLESVEQTAERAASLARIGLEGIEAVVGEQRDRVEAVRSGCVDVDFEAVLVQSQLRLEQLVHELERFDREVAQPAEELRTSLRDRRRAFEVSLLRNQARRPAEATKSPFAS